MRILLSDNSVRALAFTDSTDPEPVAHKEVDVPYMDAVVERIMRVTEEHYRDTGRKAIGVALGVKAYLSAAAFIIARENPDCIVMTPPRSGFEFDGIMVYLGTELGPVEIVVLGDAERVGELLKYWGYV